MKFTRIALIAAMTTVAPIAAMSTASAASMSSTAHAVGKAVDDSVITAKVKAAFVEDSKVDATDISVETYHGTVQLSGFADNSMQKDRAEKLASNVEGVKTVKNDIHLRSDAK